MGRISVEATGDSVTRITAVQRDHRTRRPRLDAPDPGLAMVAGE
jgi:hypothetical protein